MNGRTGYMVFPVLPADVGISNLVFATRRLVLGPNPCVAPLLQGLSRLRLFTDGSCRHPSVPWARVAAFGVVLDVSCSDADLLDTIQRFPGDPNGFPFVVVAQGLAPREQSIHRAELCAIIKTAEVAALAPQAEVEIHSDSTFALGEARKAVMGEDNYFPDLGAALQDVMQQRFKMCKLDLQDEHAEAARRKTDSLFLF